MYRNVTNIADLPELTDLESQQQHAPAATPPQHSMSDQYQRHIRNKHVPSAQAGMSRMGPPPQQYPVQERFEQLHGKQHVDPSEISCMEIANHIKDCPICSKFYDNDKSIYIIIIVVLSIICLLLLKKVLDV